MTANGPRLRIVASCDKCSHIKVTPYNVHRDVNRYIECSHPDGNGFIGVYLFDSTPQWCPLLKDALKEFTRGNPSHKVNI